MNRFIGPLFYEIFKGIGNAFGLDAGNWIVILLTLLLFAIAAIILYAIGVIIVLSIKDYFHHIVVHSTEKSQDYKWFEQIMIQICGDAPAPITIDTKNSTIQFSPIEKINYSYVTGGDVLIVSIDEKAILLKPTETDDSANKLIEKFRDDNKSLLFDNAVKDVGGNVVSENHDKYLTFYITIQKEFIHIELLPLLNKAILSFVEKTTHEAIAKGMNMLPNETQEEFIDKTDNELRKHELAIPTECRHFYFNYLKRENIIEPNYVFVKIYLHKEHSLYLKKEKIELALEELKKRQQAEYMIFEKERTERNNIEEFNKLFGKQVL